MKSENNGLSGSKSGKPEIMFCTIGVGEHIEIGAYRTDIGSHIGSHIGSPAAETKITSSTIKNDLSRY